MLNICACFPASPVMYDGYVIIPNGRPTWAPLLAASGQQLAVSNGNPTSHESLATIFPPLLPNRGGPLDRFRRGHPVSLFGPSGADQQEAQDGCQNGQLWLGVPLWESREMLFGENAIRRPQAAGRSS